MLQTIYETESCFSSTSTDANHQPLELLSGNRGSGAAMPTAGESSLSGEEGRGMRELLRRGALMNCCGKHLDLPRNTCILNVKITCGCCSVFGAGKVQEVWVTAL